MTASTLPISRLIAVSVILSPLAAQAQSLSTLLVLGSSNVIDTTERMRSYLTLSAVATDFGTTAPEYLSAQAWFSQAPQPTLIEIGRWAQTATAAQLRGGLLNTAAQAIALFTAVTTPAFSLFIDSIPYTISPASFASVTNLNGVATLVQTALAAAVATSTVVYDSNYSRFQFQDGTTGVTSTYSFPTAPTASGSILFGSNPSNLATITLQGTVVTFVTGTPTSGQVKIAAGSLPGTLANLLTFLNASVDANIIQMSYSVVGSTLYCVSKITGTGGNALTIAASAATASGSTLAGGSGTDISALLFMNSTQGGYIAQGIAAETALAAATIMDNLFGQTWYGLFCPQGTVSDQLAMAGFIQGTNNKHLLAVNSQDSNILNALATSDVAYQMKALGYTRTIVQYSSSNLYAVASLMGRAINVNYNGTNTVINLFYKQEPGVIAENLNSSQITALEGKNCNVFVGYNNNTSILEPGITSGGQYIDTMTGSDWLSITIQTAWYNLLYTTTTKVPQTDAGMHLFIVAAEQILGQAVLNGLLAPGVWNAQGFGSLNEGDFMPKGFYAYAPPVASQTQADRDARKSVAMQIACKLAGAVNTVSVAITFNN